MMNAPTVTTEAARKPATQPTRDQWLAVPRELKERRQWVCWRYELSKKGLPTKVPYTPDTTSKAKSNTPSTWRNFDEAVNCYQSRPDFFSGIGYVFAADDPYVGGDIDHSVSDGIINDDARQMLPNTYAELSPSGNGIKFIARASGDYGRKTARGELYSSKRFFTLTGNVIADHEAITHCQEQVDAFAAAIGVSTDKTKRESGSAGKGDRAELIAKYYDEIMAARKIAGNPSAVADLKRRLKYVARREGTQLHVILSGDYARFNELWPFVHLYRADGELDESQVRAVLARRLYGYSFTFVEYVVLFCDHFDTHCRERYTTKRELHAELCGLWENAIEKTNYTPKKRTSAECDIKRDVQQQRGGKGSGKDWRAGEAAKTIDRVYAAIEGYRAGAQAIIQIGALVEELHISRRTVANCLDELRNTNRIATRRLAAGGGLVVTFNPAPRDVQQHNDVKLPVSAVETPQIAVEQPVCIEETHVESNTYCVSSREQDLHISFEADHISPASTLPIGLRDAVRQAFDELPRERADESTGEMKRWTIDDKRVRAWLSDTYPAQFSTWKASAITYWTKNIRNALRYQMLRDIKSMSNDGLKKRRASLESTIRRFEKKAESTDDPAIKRDWEKEANKRRGTLTTVMNVQQDRLDKSSDYTTAEQDEMLSLIEAEREEIQAPQLVVQQPVVQPQPVEGGWRGLVERLKALQPQPVQQVAYAQ